MAWKKRVCQCSVQSILCYIVATMQQEPKISSQVPTATVVKLSALVNLQQGCVVSREVMKKPTGSVTVFAFDEDQALSEHTAPFDALAHVIEGEAEITISGAPYRVQAGEMVVMPANQPHAVKAIKPFKMMLTMIRSAK